MTKLGKGVKCEIGGKDMIESKMERIIVGAMTRRKISYQKLTELYEKKLGRKITKQALNHKVKNLFRTKDEKVFRELLWVIGVSEENIEAFVKEVC